MELREPIRERDAIKNLGKKVNGRRAKEFERGLVDTAFQARFLLFKKDDQIELVALAGFKSLAAAGDFKEKKPLRKGEIFAKQPVPFETARAERKQRFLVGEPDPADGGSGQSCQSFTPLGD